jgi:MFS family permease
MWRAFFADKPFLKVAISVCLISPLFGQLAVFSSVFAFRDLGFKPQTAAWLGMTAAGGRLALSPVAGYLTDRWGARPSLLFWALAGGAGFVFLALLPGTVSVFMAAGLAAVAGSGFSGAMNALTSGVPKPEHRAGHFTLLGFCMIAVNSATPILTGKMFDHLSYREGFIVLALLSLAVIFLSARLLMGLSARAEDYS